MIYATHRTRKLTRKDDKLASHARFITQECCRSAQRPGRRLRALQVVVTLHCTDNLPPSVIYTITRLGRAGNTAERAGTNVEGDHNRQQRARGASKRKKQQPREPRQPRKQLAAYTLIPFAVITGRHAAGAGLLPPTPVCPAAVCTAPITACTVHPGTVPTAVKRQLSRDTARSSDLHVPCGEEYTAKHCAISHMPRSRGPTLHFGCSATLLRLGDVTRCRNRALLHTSLSLTNKTTRHLIAESRPPCPSTCAALSQ